MRDKQHRVPLASTGVIPAYQVEKTWLNSRDQVKDWVWENRNNLRKGQAPEMTEDQP
jgi:hypothetical protein